jgi:hypothetical protein
MNWQAGRIRGRAGRFNVSGSAGTYHGTLVATGAVDYPNRKSVRDRTTGPEPDWMRHTVCRVGQGD